ncbi:MAG: hypothetical protein ACI8PB_002593 [Desulforhopalus sp.]
MSGAGNYQVRVKCFVSFRLCSRNAWGYMIFKMKLIRLAHVLKIRFCVSLTIISKKFNHASLLMQVVVLR